MSYVGLNMSAIDQALKNFYLPDLRYQLNDKASALLAQMEKNSEDVVGRDIRMALRYGRVGGIGNRSDDGTLPTPKARQTKKAVMETKNIFARFRLTDKTIEASKSDVGAFANMLDQEVKDCEADARLDLSRQVVGDGEGTLAKLTAQSTTDSPQEVTVDTTMYLAEGMLVDFRKTDGDLRHAALAGIEITSVESETVFHVAATGQTINSGDIVCIAGNVYKDSGNNLAAYELTGIQKVIAEGGTLYGIDRSAGNHVWLNGRVTALSGEISETAIQKEIDGVEVTSGSETNFLFCSKGVMRAYQNLQTAMKQHVNTLDMKGGWTGLSYAGGGSPIGLVSDKYVPKGILFGLDLNDWAMYQMKDWDWMEKDGAVLARVADRPAYEATLLKYCDIGCQRPRGQWKMTGIVEH